MNYTQGEWKEVGAFVISEIKDNSWDDTLKISICSTANVNNLPLGEQIANARLIAAAPDLLAALESAVSMLHNNIKWLAESDFPNNSFVARAEEILKFEQAITKAIQ